MNVLAFWWDKALKARKFSTWLFLFGIIIVVANAQFRSHGILQPSPPSYVRRWTVLLGRRVVLNCSVDLPKAVNPIQVKYRWERPEGKVIGRSKLYVIPKVQLSDGGEYICHSSAFVGFQRDQWSARQPLILEVRKSLAVRTIPYHCVL